jgi:hypothetical protein
MTSRRRALTLLPFLVLVAACNRETYPPDVVQNFVDSCKTKSEEKLCRCAIAQLQRRYTLDQFRGYESEMRGGRVPAEVMGVVADCQR